MAYRYFVRCLRHHGEAFAVCRCLSELLWVSSGGQYVTLSAASLHRLSGGHQHPSALLRPAVSPPGQPQHYSGREAQRQRHVQRSLSFNFPLQCLYPCKWNMKLFFFCLFRLQVHASWSHANLQSSVSDCCRTGIPPQEEHHLLWPQIWQHPGVVSGGLYINYYKQTIHFSYFTITLYQDKDRYPKCLCKRKLTHMSKDYFFLWGNRFVSIIQLSCVFFQEKDPVNIKLSDYGISRQSFHEGALGVEGTPGYQAPEIRPGIVYDEKVLTTSS